VGNPVRRSIQELGRESARVPGGRNVLVAGGSQGASAINDAILEASERLASSGIRVLHQTGRRDFERLRAAYQSQGLLDDGTGGPVRVEPFIEDMAGAYRWADLAVCRSGATTLAEVAVAGKPCLFIPYPHATHGHQSGNARTMAQAGAAVVVEQRDLPATDLAGLVAELLDDPARLARMAEAARRLGRPDAASDLVTEMERLVEGKSKGNASGGRGE
jgi:UDP-N-acetylglucosamine--N-acetylmuramyl-(pentapeptide) pyrophosphoryl-undecaprenol N-acetylglucosamine transferase